MQVRMWVIATLMTILSTLSVQAQESIAAQLRASPWLVMVAGESRTRTLRISDVKETNPGTYTLEAVYGWSDEGQTRVEARLVVDAEGKKLYITTQPGSKIVTTQNSEGVFTGTFTPSRGQTKGVEIKSKSDTEIQALIRPEIKPATPDVPTQCAAFLGGWTGDWGFGKRQLWVTEVSEACTVKYAHSPKIYEFKELSVKGGKLSFPCGTSGGTCHFTAHGNELWGNYGGPDGNNNTVYKKM